MSPVRRGGDVDFSLPIRAIKLIRMVSVTLECTLVQWVTLGDIFSVGRPHALA
jgi:hypothetical protein